MKQIAKSMVFLGAMLAAGSSAAFIDDFCPYVGLGYKQTWIKSRHHHFNHSFSKSFPGGEVFLGTKFCENFGAEIGYNWTTRKHRTSSFAGTWNGVYRSGTVRTSARFNSFYLDLMGYVPLENCWELIGSVGISSMKPKVSSRLINSTGFTNTGWWTGSRGKAKAVWRLGVGASYLFTECWGLRGMVRWEGTEALRVGHHHNNNGFFFGNRKPFKDAWSLALSVFVKF